MWLIRSVVLLVTSVLLFAPAELLAQRGGRGGSVRVRGYVKRDGTYVQPHYRSAPDRSPYNNWSFPGNINPYTGKIATGDPATYLFRHNNSRSSGITLPSWTDPYFIGNSTDPIGSLPTTLPSPSLPALPRPSIPTTGLLTGATRSYLSPSTTSYWRNKVQRDHGITPPEGLSDFQLMELDTHHYWLKKLARDHGLLFQPGQHNTFELMDFDTRLYWTKKINRDFGVQFDWKSSSAFDLMDAHSRMYYARRLSAKTGRQIDWRAHSTFDLMMADSGLR
jgi:hypothetical protein